MTRHYSRTEVLARLQAQIDAKSSLLVTGAGNGLMARVAEQAGADLIVVYNSGYFRLNGHPSMVGNLPVGDANEIMLTLGSRNVIPVTRETPVIGGVYGVDPTRDKADLFRQMQAIGFSGTINFPTIGRIDGNYRKDLESAGLGFGREVEAAALAHSMDIFTMCYVYNAHDAALMAEAGVDVVVGHCGSRNAMSLEQAIRELNSIFDGARKVRSDVILLSHGGPISTPADAQEVNLRTNAHGFVAASSVERIPVEGAVKDAVRQFKSIRTSA
jgi:predicted TIM-barrel enzyme